MKCLCTYCMLVTACLITGKDIIIFVTPEDHKTPSTVTLSDDVESEPGNFISC